MTALCQQGFEKMKKSYFSESKSYKSKNLSIVLFFIHLLQQGQNLIQLINLN